MRPTRREWFVFTTCLAVGTAIAVGLWALTGSSNRATRLQALIPLVTMVVAVVGWLWRKYGDQPGRQSQSPPSTRRWWPLPVLRGDRTRLVLIGVAALILLSGPTALVVIFSGHHPTLVPPRTPSPTPDSTAGSLAITSPSSGFMAGGQITMSGTASLGQHQHLWVYLDSAYLDPVQVKHVSVTAGVWQVILYFNLNEPGNYFVHAIVVDEKDNQTLKKTSDPRHLSRPQKETSIDVSCCRNV